MNPQFNIIISGTGSGVGSCVVTNQDMEKRVETSDEWIYTRTGIRERRFTAPGETTLTMGVTAARQALANAQLQPTDLDMIVFGTITPHYPLPATACLLQAELGCREIPAFDIAAACSGFVYGLIIAAQFMHNGQYRHILVVGTENLSSVIDWQDRSSAILFGDGSGAVIISAAPHPEQGILYSHMGADGRGAKLIWIPGGGSGEPVSNKVVNERLHVLRMQGREVYKFAVTRMVAVIEDALKKTALSVNDISLFLLHQSNQRIIESGMEKLSIPREKVVINIDRYGNTSAASIGLCLDEARRTGRIKSGDIILLAAFGAGLTWASAVIRV
ncbi:MAG: 3-oxoacyl-[acyl-carrier-protein] synthase 3 [Phycisphaerae bacterium]|nr:3-oxoacyl-[acyl-carrier-protein] synthase 3 [Phycisphaerae bacterium]